jgi:predicted phosphodiesterase
VVLGHTHVQICERAGKALVINPGSAGETRDYGHGRVLSCCVLDTSSGEATFDTFANPSTALR